MFSYSMAAVVGFITLVGSPAAAAPSICDAIPGNLIVNCGFEKGGFPGWTQSGNTGFSFVVGSLGGLLNNPNSGFGFAALGPVGSDGFLSQTFSDTAGQPLRLEFFMASHGGTSNDFNDFHAAFNDNILLSLTNDGAHAFTDYVFTVTATGLDTLTIGGFRHDIGYFGLDDISVAPVPEPGSMGLLGVFLAGLGIWLWRGVEPPRCTLDQNADSRAGHPQWPRFRG